jgi:hypothetical protein
LNAVERQALYRCLIDWEYLGGFADKKFTHAPEGILMKHLLGSECL